MPPRCVDRIAGIRDIARTRYHLPGDLGGS